MNAHTLELAILKFLKKKANEEQKNYILPSQVELLELFVEYLINEHKLDY